MQAVVAKVRRINLRSDLGAPLIENLFKNSKRDGAITIRQRLFGCGRWDNGLLSGGGLG